jgi:hypothetical protein
VSEVLLEDQHEETDHHDQANQKDDANRTAEELEHGKDSRWVPYWD